MFTAIRNGITRLMLPVVWACSSDHAARALKRFGDTESDSGWQYLQAIEHTDDNQLKRMLFSNVLEEYRHSDYFYCAAYQLATQRLHSTHAARTRLVQTPKGMAYFLAYAHECEHSIHGQFDTFALVCRLPAVATVFRRICADEEDHKAQAHDFLTQAVDGSIFRTRWMVLRAKAARFYESWMRASQRIGDVTFGVLLSIVFFAFGPLLTHRKPRATGHLQPLSSRQV